MSITEKRKFTRIPFHTKITISAGETTYVSNQLRDIGLGGAFILLEGSLPAGTACTLDIDLIGPASLLRIQIEGEVVRAQQNGIAIKFTKIDLDSLLHLKHMIKVFTQDPELIHHEFVANLLEAEE
jgi:c-di-GMP-binding flagellar brake protein YcgR